MQVDPDRGYLELENREGAFPFLVILERVVLIN